MEDFSRLYIVVKEYSKQNVLYLCGIFVKMYKKHPKNITNSFQKMLAFLISQLYNCKCITKNVDFGVYSNDQ